MRSDDGYRRRNLLERGRPSRISSFEGGELREYEKTVIPTDLPSMESEIQLIYYIFPMHEQLHASRHWRDGHGFRGCGRLHTLPA